MKIAVKENRKLVIINPQNTQNENDVETIELIVPTKYEDFNKRIAFVTKDGVIWGLFENNLYKIPSSITQYKQVKFYIWLVKDNQDFRSEEKLLVLNENHPVTGEVTPKDKSDIEQVIDTLEAEINKVDNIDITARKIGKIATLTITDKDGNITSVDITDGNDGEKGDKGDKGAKGDKGDKGDPGTNGQDGKDGKDGINGTNGKDGINGKDGKDGYIPVRGTDYWTSSDIATIEAYCANYIDANITQVLGGSY